LIPDPAFQASLFITETAFQVEERLGMQCIRRRDPDLYPMADVSIAFRGEQFKKSQSFLFIG